MAQTEQIGSIDFHKAILDYWQWVLENSKMDADGLVRRY